MAVTLPPSAAADSYISLEEAATYLGASLSGSAWATATDASREAALRAATAHLDAEDWKGSKVHSAAENTLRWPRAGVYDLDGDLIGSTEVPVQLKLATAELALMLLEDASASEAAATSESPVQELKLGTIALKFDTSRVVASGAFSQRYRTLFQVYIAPLVRVGRFSMSVGLVRA